ncbi:PREDICTED: uncharacterized protein LOC107074585 isoform X1 [Polistes dominula]|uniref:Uncharacterized protein LOC107074585 isoform X1 n=1 Tax=Polistes dominula TaxID=743375 RepID=A0ABM1JGN8_POLDO|nr:PREDICTED: uncharacterized protein LOC107074585 isoform X1 [Polistes dominula]
MTSWINCFYVALCLMFFGTFTLAIYDPKETTTKAPNRLESFLPWYLNEKDLQPPDDLARSAKWWTNAEENEPRKPVIVNSDSTSWTPWRKTSGSEIELRTEIRNDQISKQHHDHDQFDQIDDHPDDHPEHPPEGQYEYGSTSTDKNVYQDRNNPETSGNKLKHKLSEDSDSTLLYEGIGSESTKPRQERILFWNNPISTVAHYDFRSGVQCPNLDSTGQFIYPPDCKFFVNCWKGRAFVQPCAPGTLFNPETLECDFPYKVTCYGSEISDPIRYSKAYNLKIDEGQEESHKPKCPPHVAGLIPHPTDCTKFLNCANGMAFEMDCGPGTVFNPALSVCDWPYNVRGCEDTFKSKEHTTKIFEVPPDPNFHNHNVHDNSNNNFANQLKHNTQSSEKKIECPDDFTGLLPHPENCRKFLQCANGITYVMDCGPGTAFNPLISVCDWPHKVPACKEEKKFKQVTTTSRPWPPYSRGDPESSHEHPRYNHTYNRYNNHGQGFRNNQIQPITTTELPRTVWRPTWRPMIQKPMNNLQNQSNSMGSINNYENYQNHGHHHDHGYHHDHGHYHYNHSRSGQPMTEVNCNITNHMTHSPNPYDSRDINHHYHYHYHHYLPKINDTQYPGNRRIFESDGHQQGSPTIHNTEETWNHANHSHTNIDDFNKQQTNNQSGESTWRFDSYVPTRHRFNSTVHLYRINNGRNNPEFDNRQTNESTSSNKNIYVNNDYDSHDEVESRDRTNRNLSVQIGTSFSRPNQNNITWSRPTTFVNHSDNSNQPSSRPWNQGYQRTNVEGLFSMDEGSRKSKENDAIDEEEKLREWYARTNIQRQTIIDKEVDSKMNKWLSKTNVFLQAKGQVSTGYKNSTQKKPLYPYGIYVNSNGIKGHFITKELEINQGHSKTKTYNHNNQHTPFSFNQTYGSIYTRTPLHNQETTKSPIIPSNHYPIQYTPNSVNIPQPFDGNFTNRFFNQSTSKDLKGAANDYSTGKDFHFPVYSTINRSVILSQHDPRRTINRSIKQFDFNPLTSENVGTEKIPDVHLKPSKNISVPVPQDISENESNTTNPNIPSISIEDNTDGPELTDTELTIENKTPTSNFNGIVPEDDLDSYEVDVLEDKGDWKPVLVFENKTKPASKNDSSVIMRINKKNTDVDIFNVEVAPYQNEEPPFPVYYIPPVHSLLHSKKVSPPTPISGQVIRLRDGPSSSDGYVEVQGAQPGWGIVCDSRNSWSLKEAHVVCRQLGYSRGAEMAWQGRSKRNGMPTWIAANSVTCSGNEIRFQSCKFTHGEKCRVERDAIGVRCLPNRIVHCRKDEIPHDGQCYHLADSETGLNHAEALQYCSKRNSRLIDIISQAENDFISEWLSQSHPEIGSIMTSGVGFTTFNRTLWLWEDSSRSKFKFTKWWPGWMEDKKLPPWVGSRPACIIMKRKFPCHNRPESICVADYFFWDVEDCATSMKGHAYICKRPYNEIGCIYGKGNQYFGTANITESGKECLPWADNRVLHYLNMAVPNRDVKKKLQPHNYCRNPNPNVETMPWCYTGSFGEREYCDLPPCGKIESKKMHLSGQCKSKHFECLPGECIPSPWVCDGEEDCTNGADERACIDHMDLYQKFAKHRLEGYDVEKWLNTPLKTCALRCKEADFTCRSFAHKASGNICLLSDSNIGLTGALKPMKDFDYYEMKERSIKCDDMFICENRKCINHTLVCNGKNDCNDRTDENICTVENLDYAIRLAGSDNLDEGRIEVKILGVWGQVCDDGFGMINADVICKELGFPLGALEIKPGGYYGNLDPPTRFMVDQLKCRGNETSLRHCDFEGWGVHNCQPEEAVGVVCKTAVDTCQEGHWKCENSPECIPIAFICDVVQDCSDKSDESDERCNAPFDIRLVNGSSPLEGRVEVYHHGIWGTVCDDDFSAATARVICRSLGYNGVAKPKKDGFFGPGQGPIWLDEVFCHGNETQLYRCNHDQWGQTNCDHNEDAGVICSYGNANDDSEYIWNTVTDLPESRINDVLPANCGKRSEDFNDDEDLIFAKVVHGSIAPKGTYPWQASIRVRGHSRSNHWCGAVVLSPLHVLTAAHCLEGYNKGTYFVRAGDYNTEEEEGTEREANIEDYYIHEDFRKGHRMNNDIALILLKGQGIPLGKDIMPICLPPENTEYPAGLNCTISGFGSIETGRTTPSRNLRYGWIPLLDQSVCRAEHVYGAGKISDGMVCAGHLNEGVDTCDGDSGGPLACYHNGAFTLYGITSWGQHCGKANKPGVYVRVAHYRRWIDQKIIQSLSGR